MKFFSYTFTLALFMSGGLGEDVLAEALSTTSIGTGSRSISWVPAVTTNAEVTAEPIEEEISGPIICHRVTAPSSVFTIEIGASGCMMTGGVRNFASSMSGHVMVLYYPFTARSMSTSDDDAVSLRQTSFTNIYINGTAGFSKITLSDPLTPLSYTVDNLDAGLGIGYSYRLFKYVAIGMEGSYVYSSSLSPEVASGSSSLIQVLAGITVFL